MTIYTTTEARSKLFQIVNEINRTHEPVYIKGNKANAVIISEKDYEGLQETLAIYSVPGLVDEILQASKEPLSECVEWSDDV